MGCNTSNESVSQPDRENADGNEDNKGQNKQDKGDQEDKPVSAKTITLTSNGTLVSGGGSDRPDSSKSKTPTAEPEIEEAATKIQAAFRGHKARQSMKQPVKQGEAKSTPQQEFKSDDSELCDAATKIQASFRGHLIRKQMEKKNEAPSKEEKKQENAEELDIDLGDPELNKAAVKIQASFRGHMVRKEHEHDQEQEQELDPKNDKK